MSVLPIDLTAVIAIVMGSLIFLVPIAGLTARFALKPLVETLARAREAQGMAALPPALEQRLDLLEQQIQQLDGNVSRISEELEFLRQLATPAGNPAVGAGRG